MTPASGPLTARSVAGVDRFKDGWVAVVLHEGAFHRALARRTAGDLLHALPDVRVIAIDIPMHPPRYGVREADRAARAFLGRGGSSVFSTPPRAVLAAADYDDARKAARELGLGVTKQAFNLASKILEVDALVAADHQIIEVHPEVSFRHLVGEPIPGKKTWSGFARRRSALAGAGIVLPDDIGEASVAATDDVLDAAAAAWSADRFARRHACRLPVEPTPHGSEGVIWY